MADVYFVEKSYGPKATYFEIQEGASTLTLARLNEFARENNIDPEFVQVKAECDHYEGPEGPEKCVEISWAKDKVGT